MSNRLCAVIILSCAAGLRAQSTVSPSETWQSGYTGRDANGPHVLGYWQFKPDAVTNDSSAKGNHLALVGARAAGSGRFDGALESFPGHPVEDKRHAAVTGAK